MQSMKFIPPFLLLPFLFTLSLWSASPVPYSGKIDIRGVNYFGEAQFAFSLHDGNGTVHWRNGNQAGETIKVTIRNGRYSVLLGGQGMNSLTPELFLNHDKLYLKVEFDNEDGKGLRHLAPDQLITATPRALVAELAKVSEVAKVAQVAEKVGNGVITRDMLSQEVLSQLDANATASPSAPITITRDMLPQDVRDDLNKTVTITRNMLPTDVLADLNKSSTTASPITLSMLAPEVTAKLDQNITIGASSINKSMLAQEVLNDLNRSTTVINPPLVGSTLAVPHGASAPAGYSLYQRGESKELVWEEKAPVSVARRAYDGVEVLDGKIYFVGGSLGGTASTFFDLVERYDPEDDTWQISTPMGDAINYLASSVINNYLFVIGGNISGNDSSTVILLDNVTEAWTTKNNLPISVRASSAVTHLGSIYLVGGYSAGNQINNVYKYEMTSDTWVQKASLLEARDLHNLVSFNGRIWAIGGMNSGGTANTVESYDHLSDSWQTEKPLNTNRNAPVTWAANGKIYVGGGTNGSNIVYQSIEVYDPTTKHWTISGNLPENISYADAAVLNDEIYVIAGNNGSSFSNKVFAADLNASVDGVYDLYRKDGNASAGTPVVQAEVADGSVTASKLANNTITTSQLNEQILKYLKPEITAQPQPQTQTFYADSNVSFSVTAEGKYLSYQWKKDGSSLTGETNATLNITDANATLHDGNYSVVVSNDFGSVESGVVEVLISSFSVISIPNIELWLDSSDSSTFTLNIQKVSIWHDKSGNENNATQTLANKQPEFGQDQNGKFVKFTSSYTNGDADRVLADNYLIVPPISFKSSFFIIDHDGSKVSMLLGSKESLKSYLIIGGNDFAISVDGNGAQDVGSWWYNGAFQATGTDMGATGLIPLNTPSLHSVIYQLNDPMFSFHRIGSYRDNKAGFGGKIREIVIFDDYLNEPNRQRVEGYLAHKWDLVADLPSDHPYKNNAP